MNWRYKPSGERPFYILVVVLSLSMGLALWMVGVSENFRNSPGVMSPVLRWDGWELYSGAPRPSIKIEYGMEKQTSRLVRVDFHLVEDMLYSKNEVKQVQPVLTAVMKQLKTPVPFQK